MPPSQLLEITQFIINTHFIEDGNTIISALEGENTLLKDL
jgi:hypothetical protein